MAPLPAGSREHAVMKLAYWLPGVLVALAIQTDDGQSGLNQEGDQTAAQLRRRKALELEIEREERRRSWHWDAGDRNEGS